MDYKNLIEALEKLLALLKEPHTGLATWHEAKNNARAKLLYELNAYSE